MHGIQFGKIIILHQTKAKVNLFPFETNSLVNIQHIFFMIIKLLCDWLVLDNQKPIVDVK